MRGFGEVWRAEAADVAAAAEALAVASVDEAVASWITPDEETRRRRAAVAVPDIAAWLAATRGTAEIHLVGGGGGTVAGLALWHHIGGPGGAADGDGGADGDGNADGDGDDGYDGEALARVYAPEELARMGRVQELVGARHPEGPPHWYLSQTTVVPDLRGRGLGGSLLRYQLARLDQEKAAAYLEASTPRNRALYERCGFRAAGAPIALPGGGPRLQPMWRAGLSGFAGPAA